MALATDAVGKTFGPFRIDYTSRDTGIYALAVGADETEQIYFSRRSGPLVLPTFAIAPGFQAAAACLPELGLVGLPVLHGEQCLRVNGPVPPQGCFETELTVRGIYDKGKGALLDLVARTRVDGKDLAENEIGYFVPGIGGFGGERGPKPEKHPPPDRLADHRVSMETGGTQSILYNLSALPDPAFEALPEAKEGNLHTEPEAARAAGFPAPLLHGICTMGYLARAVIRTVLKDDPLAVRAIRGRFSAPVFPGEALLAELWEEGDKVIAQMKNEDGVVVVSDALIESGAGSLPSDRPRSSSRA